MDKIKKYKAYSLNSLVAIGILNIILAIGKTLPFCHYFSFLIDFYFNVVLKAFLNV